MAMSALFSVPLRSFVIYVIGNPAFSDLAEAGKQLKEIPTFRVAQQLKSDMLGRGHAGHT